MVLSPGIHGVCEAALIRALTLSRGRVSARWPSQPVVEVASNRKSIIASVGGEASGSGEAHDGTLSHALQITGNRPARPLPERSIPGF